MGVVSGTILICRPPEAVYDLAWWPERADDWIATGRWQRSAAGLGEELTVFAVAALRLAALLPQLAVVLNMLRGVVIVGMA